MSFRTLRGRVPPYQPQTNRASATLGASAGASLAAGLLRERFVVVFGAPFTAVKDDPHIAPVLKMAAQLFVSV